MQKPATIQADAAWGSARVLLIDDDQPSLRLAEQILESGGYRHIRCVSDSSRAIEQFEQVDPDLVVLDLQMPSPDGYQILSEIRSRLDVDDWRPVVVVTADYSSSATDRALSAGAFDLLTKPYRPDEFLLRVGNLLYTRRLYTELRDQNVSLARSLKLASRRARNESAYQRHWEARVRHVLRVHSMTMVFQPIVDLRTKKPIGVEALARFPDEPRLGPEEWFAGAAEIGAGIELEMLAIELALRHHVPDPDGGFLAVNASPSTISHPGLLDAIRNSDVPVVVELTEHAQVDDFDAVGQSISTLRAAHARVAVDDTGSGFAGLSQLLRLRPDVIKLDRFLITGLESDVVRSALVSAMNTFAQKIGALLIAEGVETEAELAALRELGVGAAQGYLLGRPRPPAPRG